MVRGDIIGGLKVALSRGESLQKAMQSFYNSGYKKEDIEEAARTLHAEGFTPPTASVQPTTPTTQPQPTQIKKPEHPSYQPPIKTQPQIPQAKPTTPTAPTTKPLIPPKPTTPTHPTYVPHPKQTTPAQIPRQTISHYGQPEKKGVDFVTILMIAILVILVGVLISVFIFREDLVNFLNTILS